MTLCLLGLAPVAQEAPLDPALARHLTSLAEDPSTLSPAIWDELVEADHAQVYRAIVKALDQDALPSAVVRARALRALGRFAVDSSEVDRRENAVQVLYDRAIGAPTQAERMAACQSLSTSGDFAREVLLRVVETEPETWARLAAFEIHAENVEPGDYVTYRELAGFSLRERLGEGQSGDSDPLLRPTAFEGVVERLSTEELERALEDEDLAIVESALRLMGQRGYPEAMTLARKLIEEKEVDGPIAFAAVDLFGRAEALGALGDFMDLAKSRSMDLSVQRRAAEWVAGYAGAYVVKNEVRKRLETARAPQLYFALQAVAKREELGRDARQLDQENNEEKVDEALIGLLKSKDPLVASWAALGLVRHGGVSALEDLARQGEKAESPEVRAVMLACYGELVEPTSAKVFEPLLEALGAEDLADPVLAAATSALIKLEPSIHEEFITAALESPSTAARIATIEGLTELGWEDAPLFLVEALPSLRGRVRTRAIDSLRETSGLDLGDTTEAWTGWWEEAKEARRRGEVEEEDPDAEQELPDGLTEQGIDADEFEEEAPPPPPSPAEYTVFGRPIDSAALLVSIDGGPGGKLDFVSERRQLTQLEAVQAELVRWIAEVPEGVLFDLQVLGAGASGRLFGEPRAVDEETRAAAVEFLGALRSRTAPKDPIAEWTEAFSDPRFDSAILVDLGSLEQGPAGQLAAFELWNAHRSRVVHGVCLGRRSGILKWLANGTGGDFVYAP